MIVAGITTLACAVLFGVEWTVPPQRQVQHQAQHREEEGQPQQQQQQQQRATPEHVATSVVFVEHLENDYWTCFVRIAQLVQALRTLGHSVSLVTATGDWSDKWATQYSHIGVQLHRFRDVAAVRAVLRSADFVLYSAFWWELDSVFERVFATVLRHAPTTARHVLVTDDVGWVSKAGTHEQQQRSSGAWVQRHVQRYRQLRVFRQVHAIVTITPEDKEIIDDELAIALPGQQEKQQQQQQRGDAGEEPRSKVHWVSLASAPPLQRPLPPFLQRADAVVFVGNGNNPTNEVGLRWFVDEVWPRVSTPRPVVYVIGNDWGDKSDMHSYDFVFLGEKDELTLFLLSARVAITPAVTGTGLNTKTVSYLAAGLPVVSTTKGVRGIPVQGTEAVAVEDTPEGFARELDALMWQRERWERASEAARRLVSTSLSQEKVTQQLAHTLQGARLPDVHGRQGTVSPWDYVPGSTVVVPEESAERSPVEVARGEVVTFSLAMFEGTMKRFNTQDGTVRKHHVFGSAAVGPGTVLVLRNTTTQHNYTTTVVAFGPEERLMLSLQVVLA